MKKLLLIGVVFVTLLFTGCWDMIEINQRIFPYMIGMDLNDNDEGKFMITFSYPNIYALGKSPTQEDRVHVISVAADSGILIHHIGSRLQYPIYTKLMKVIVISEEVANDEKLMRQIVDGINRDFIINKKIQMVVVKGSAEDFIKKTITSKVQESIEGPVYSILINDQDSTQFTPKAVIDFITDMDKSKVSISPLGIPLEEDIEILGGALFKNYKLAGYIDHKDNRSIAILNDDAIDDDLHGEYADEEIAIYATNFKSKRKLLESKEEINVLFSVEVEGQLHEYTLRDERFIDTVEIIQDMEKALEDKLKMELEETIDRLQKVHNADAINVGHFISKFHPKLWKEVGEDWEEIFPDINIIVEVDVKLRRRGLTM